MTPDVEVGDVEAPNGGGSSASSGGGGEDGASGAIPPLDVVKEQHRSGTNAGSSSGKIYLFVCLFIIIIFLHVIIY